MKHLAMALTFATGIGGALANQHVGGPTWLGFVMVFFGVFVAVGISQAQ